MIIVFGSLNMDLIFNLELAPEAGETVLLKDYVTLPGGKGANQAVAAARMGSSVTIAGGVGQDGFGDRLMDILSRENVDTSLTARFAMTTGTAIITVDRTGENRIMVASGSNLETKAAQIPDSLLVKGNSILMQMETPTDQIAEMARRAFGKVDRVILNLAPALPISADTLEHVDIFILNEIEILQLAKHIGFSDQDYLQTAKDVAAKFDLTCVITLGGDGAIAVEADGTTHKAAALPLEKIVDTTGAGDAFCGTLAAMLDQGKSFEEALPIACASGSLACLTLGAMNSYPKFQDVMQSMGLA